MGNALNKLATAIVTFGYVGRSRLAPGTVGSAVAAVLGWWIRTTFGHSVFYEMLLAGGVCSIVFIPLYLDRRKDAGSIDKGSAIPDPQEIVIDEAIGQWIALIPCKTGEHALLAFVLFRVLDILKPWPISWADRISGSVWQNTCGILLDDALAGTIAALLLVFGLRF